MPKLAFLDILIIQYFTIQTYYAFLKVNKLAAYLLLPYLSWLLVAFSLNLYIILNN